MDIIQYQTMLLGIELKKETPRGVRNRVNRLLENWSQVKIKQNVFLLEKDKAAVYQEYVAPLVKKYGRESVYTLDLSNIKKI